MTDARPSPESPPPVPTKKSDESEIASREKKAPKSLTPEQRREILHLLFFEGSARSQFVWQFYTLLLLSTVIASVGLLLDSTAVVIGAMLLSPLMTPILAIAAAIVMGWPTRAGRNMLRVGVATLFVFAIAYLLPLLSGFPKDVYQASELSAEITSRTNPNVGDLLVALCAGTAAAYMLVRKEALSALPGVAIAVALVPPLCVSGILACLEAWNLAWEAFVLYATNLTAIVLTAGSVLLFMGFKPKIRDRGRETRVATGFALASVLVLMVAVPLAARAVGDLRDLRDRIVASRVIEEWIGENDIDMLTLQVEDDVFRIGLRVNLPVDALYVTNRLSLLSHLDSDTTLASLDERLTAALGKEVMLQVTGNIGFAGSTCPEDGCPF